MAINKNDYLDGNGNYDLKKSLVDELIDGVDAIATKTQNLPNNGSFNPENTLYLYRNVPNTNYVVDNIPTTIDNTGMYLIFSWQPNAALSPSAYLLGTSYSSTTLTSLTHLGGTDNLRMTQNNLRIKVAGYWQIKIYRII